MAGEAKSTGFMLSTATVMIGAATDMFNLTPEAHSVGLVKNFTTKSEPTYTELTQGVKNTTVFSVMTGNKVSATMETYEFTGKNMAYALGLNGAEIAAQTAETTVATAVAAPVAPALTAATLEVTSATNIAAGEYIMIEYGEDDKVVVREVISKAADVLTLNAGFAFAIPQDAKVKVVNVVGIGSKDEQPFLSAVVAGTLADGTNVMLYYPKIRIVKGFEMGFKTDSYGNMPMEFTIYDLVPTDSNYEFFRKLGNSNSMVAVAG